MYYLFLQLRLVITVHALTIQCGNAHATKPLRPKIYRRIFSVLFEVRLVAAIIVLWSVRQRVLGRLQRRRMSHDKCGDHTVSSAIFEVISTVRDSFIMGNTVRFVTECGRFSTERSANTPQRRYAHIEQSPKTFHTQKDQQKLEGRVRTCLQTSGRHY